MASMESLLILRVGQRIPDSGSLSAALKSDIRNPTLHSSSIHPHLRIVFMHSPNVIQYLALSSS